MRHAIISLVLALTCAGCFCRKPESRVEPELPKNLAGWHQVGEKGYVPIGDLVVKEGEYTEHDGLRIKVVELIPPNYCHSSVEFSGGARAKVQFIDAASNRIICEELFREHSGGNSRCDFALRRIDSQGMGWREINLKGRWVHFVVFGYRGMS